MQNLLTYRAWHVLRVSPVGSRFAVFNPGLRAAGVVNTGAEPTHPEGSKDNARKIHNPKIPPLPY